MPDGAERPGGTVGRPGGKDGAEDRVDSVDRRRAAGEAGTTSGESDPRSDSMAAGEVGERQGGGVGGPSESFFCRKDLTSVDADDPGVNKVDAGVGGREEEACEGVFAVLADPLLRSLWFRVPEGRESLVLVCEGGGLRCWRVPPPRRVRAVVDVGCG